MADTVGKARAATAALKQAAQAAAAPPLGETPTKKGRTAKSKEARGVPPGMITSWVDFNVKPEDHEVLVRASKTRGKTLAAMLGQMLSAGLTQEWDAIQADAALYTPGIRRAAKPLDEMTADELMAEAQRLEREAARVQAQVDAARRRAANAG